MIKRSSITSTAKLSTGFTLIEVLVALAIIAIALTAIIQASTRTIATNDRVKKRSISHQVQLQAMSLIQTGIIQSKQNTITQATTLFKQKWYWQAKKQPTAYKQIERIVIRVSDKPQGPFLHSLVGYRYLK